MKAPTAKALSKAPTAKRRGPIMKALTAKALSCPMTRMAEGQT
jgi:hypothetical protein